MSKPRAWRESRFVFGKKKDGTGRTPITEYCRTGDLVEVFHGHLLDSAEDVEAIKRVNASCDETLFPYRKESPSNL